MIVGITQGIGNFTLILAVIVIGFSLSFHVPCRAGTGIISGGCGNDGILTQFSTAMSIVGGYTLMLGDFDLEEYTASSSMTASARSSYFSCS